MKGVFKNWYLAIFIGLLVQGCGNQQLVSDLETALGGSESEAASGFASSISSSVPSTTNSLEIPISINLASAANLKASDLACSGCIVANCSGSGTSYKCTVIPKDVSVSVQLVSGTLKNSSGTPNSSSNVMSFVVSAADTTYGLCIKASNFYKKYGNTLGF